MLEEKLAEQEKLSRELWEKLVEQQQRYGEELEGNRREIEEIKKCLAHIGELKCIWDEGFNNSRGTAFGFPRPIIHEFFPVLYIVIDLVETCVN
jgi:hypothetical protein